MCGLVGWNAGTRRGAAGPRKEDDCAGNSTSVQIPRHGRSGSRGSLAKAQSAGGHRPNAIAIQKQPPPYLPLCRPSDTKQETLKPEGGEGGGGGTRTAPFQAPCQPWCQRARLTVPLLRTGSRTCTKLRGCGRDSGWVRLRYAAAHAATRGRAGACFAHTHRHICIRCTQTACSTHT